MKLSSLLFAIVFLLIAGSVQAQISPTWASIIADTNPAGTGTHYPSAIAVRDGTISSVGLLNAGLSIDGVSQISGSSYADGFIAVYKDYTLQFAKRLGNTSGYDFAKDTAISGSGDVYAVGRAGDGGTVSIVDHLSVSSVEGRTTAYLVKISATGTPMWVRDFDGNDYSSDLAESVSISPSGHVTAAGHFEGDVVTISGNQFSAPALPKVSDSRVEPSNYAFSINRENVFVASYEDDGTYRWATAFGSETRDGTYGMASGSDGSVYLSGYVTGPTDFGLGLVETSGTYESYTAPDATVRPIPNPDAFKGFLTAFEPDGAIRWAKVFHSPGQSSVSKPFVSADGTLWAAVYFTESLDLDGDDAADFESSPYENGRILVQYTAAGVLESATRIPEGMAVSGIAQRPEDDRILIVGSRGPVDFNLDGVIDAEPSDVRDLAVMDLFDEQGVLLWSLDGVATQTFVSAICLETGAFVGAGYTYGDMQMGSLPGITAHGVDGFLMLFDLLEPVVGVRYGTASEGEIAMPSSIRLEPAYPNPFNPSTTIRYGLPTAQRVRLDVYDVTGRLVDTLVNRFVEAGYHDAVLDGSQLPSGTYLYRLSSRETAQSGTITLLK